MDLNDLIKLAGIQNAQAPVQEEPVVSSSDGMRTMIALVTPEQLNQLTGDAPVAEEMPGEATTEPNPQEYEGTLGSPADLSLRRYLGANGEHVTVDETNVYEDHKVEDITEAWNAYKTDPIAEAHACGCDDSCACGGNCGPNCNCHSGCNPTNESHVNEDAGKVGYMEMFFTDRDGGEVSQEVEVTLKDGRLDVTGPLPGPEDDLYWDDADIEEQLRDAMQDMSVITWMNEAVTESEGTFVGINTKTGDFEFGLSHEEVTSGRFTHMLPDDETYFDPDTAEELVGAPDEEMEAMGWEKLPTSENAFNQAAAAAARANKSEFEFGGKKYKTKMSKDTAHKLDDDIDVLKQLAGL